MIHGTATSHGITVPEATPISGVAASDVLTADSTTHRWLQNPNNAGATVIAGTSTTAATAGNCVKYAANGYDITDAGAACGSGSGGVTSLNSLTGALNITGGTGITVTPSGSNIQVSTSPFGFPTGSVAGYFGNSWFLQNGFTTITVASGSCTTGTCTYTTSTPHNYQAGQSIGMSGFANSCSNINTTVASTADVYHYVVSGTTCGTTSLATGSSNEITTSVSCTSNICTITSGNSFAAGDTVVINSGFSPSSIASRAYKVLSTGLSSSQFEIDTTNWGNAGTTTGTGGIYWNGATSIPTYSCTKEPWFLPFGANCFNYAIGGETWSSLVSNYSSIYHPVVANMVTLAAGNPVIILLYANESTSTTAADEANMLTFAADLHAEGSNVQVWIHTIPPAVFSDPNGIGHTIDGQNWAAESTWMFSQLSSNNAPATGKYFDRVISLNGVINSGMNNPDNIHLNNSGTKAFSDVDNTEAGLRGGGLKQNSPSLSGINWAFNPSYYCDGTNPSNCFGIELFNNGGTNYFGFGTGDPRVVGGYTNIGTYETNGIVLSSSGCWQIAASTTKGAPGDTFLGRNAAGNFEVGTSCGGSQGGFDLTYLDVQATTAPTGSCTTAGRWEWAKDGTSAWCNGSTWQVVGSTAFSALGSGTNTTAAMVVGSGASLAPTGTGSIQANNIASTVAASSPITLTGSGTVASPYTFACPTCSVGSGTSVSVNGAAALGSANLNDTTPVAGTNGKNVAFQVSGSNVSAEVVGDGNAAHYLDGTGAYSTPAGTGGALSNITSSVTATGCTVSGNKCAVSGTSTSAVMFSVIPGTFNHLRLVVHGNATTGTNGINITLNSDTGTNYGRTGIFANGTSATSNAGAATQSSCGTYQFATGGVGTVTFDLPYYADTNFIKQGQIAADDVPQTSATTNYQVQRAGCTWNNTAAVTSITVTMSAANFNNGTLFTLYGIN